MIDEHVTGSSENDNAEEKNSCEIKFPEVMIRLHNSVRITNLYESTKSLGDRYMENQNRYQTGNDL
jgi:hypothetical protein